VLTKVGERRAERYGRTSAAGLVSTNANWTEAVTGLACVLASAIMIIAVVCEVVARCFFDRPSYWPASLSILVLVWGVLLGLSVGARHRYRDANHHVEVWEGPIVAEIDPVLAKEAIFLSVGRLYRGERHRTAPRPIRSFENFKGLKISVASMNERLTTWRVFGAKPAPMPRQRRVLGLTARRPRRSGGLAKRDSQLQPIRATQKHLLLTPHVSSSWTYQFNATRLAALPPMTQAEIRKAADRSPECSAITSSPRKNSVSGGLRRSTCCESSGLRVVRGARQRGREAAPGAAAVVRQDRGAISVTFTADEPIARQAIGSRPSGERGL
jgi:hypothetical protein